MLFVANVFVLFAHNIVYSTVSLTADETEDGDASSRQSGFCHVCFAKNSSPNESLIDVSPR